MRDSIGKIDPAERQESIIGQDADGFYYQYFPQFNETDIRIYKHKYCRMSMALKLKQVSVF